MSTAPARARSGDEQSDASLINECLKGNEAAWAALIDKYKNLIFSIPVRYGFSEDDSADIFQSVCMDLLEALPRLRNPKALPKWLIQVARNKCFHRKQALRRNPTEEIGDVDPPASAEEPGAGVEQMQQEQLLLEALSELPPQCQRLVQMLFFEIPPRPYQEVAKELNLAQGSIGFTRRDCLDRLLHRLKKLGY
jgi:RNA polymerase sigma factor (sigma-70 family)